MNRVVERINANDTSTVYTYTPRSEVESIINYKNRRRGPDQVVGSYGYIYNAKGQRIHQVEGDGNLTAYTYDPAGQLKEVYYPFADKKKVEDYKERYYYGLLPEYDQPCRFRLNIPNLYWDEQASLNDQIRDLFGSFNKDFDDDKYNNGQNRGQKEKEVEVSCGHNNLPFVSKLDLDYQNRNRIEEMFRKVREGRGYLDLHKGFWKEEYTYDPNGNITQKRNGWGSIDYQYNQANQLQQAGNRVYRYDPNGNTVQEVLGKYKIDYTYNYENRLIKANSQFNHHFCHWPVKGEVSFGYDALGRMVKKELNPVYGPKNETEMEYYIYNGLGLDILADYKYQTRQYGRYGVKGELDGVNEYYYGNGLLLASKRFDGQGRGHWGWDRDPLKDVSFYHHDALGSVVMITERNGHIDKRYEYDIWGKAYEGKFKDGLPGEGHTSNVYGFTGQRYQPELGVYSFAYRDYSPRTMRWMTIDPIKDGMNWYSYCANNPVNFIDLLGLCTESLPDVNIGFQFGPPDPYAGLFDQGISNTGVNNNGTFNTELSNPFGSYNAFGNPFNYDLNNLPTLSQDDPISRGEQLLGTPYGHGYEGQSGGSITVSGTPEELDCTEFISYAFQTPLYRTWEFNTNPSFDMVVNPQRGDVVIDQAYDTNGNLVTGHASIYTGEGGQRALLQSSASLGVSYTSDYVQAYYQNHYDSTDRTYYRRNDE